MSAPDLSVVIPVYNRGELVRHTLQSVRRASAGLGIQVVIVDDGSELPASDSIARLGFCPDKIIRQSNQGLLFARLAGLAEATGRYVLFLDSDDLVAPEKFLAHVEVMDRTGCEVSYSDTAKCNLAGDYDGLAIQPDEPLRPTTEAADFFIKVQPAPHSPVFRTDYLHKVVQRAFFPPSALYNSVAEIWFYHNAAPQTARVVHVPGALAIIGSHPTVRLTNHWERLAVGSLAVMEAFARSVPATPENERVRRLVGEKAFAAWRRLPRHFSQQFDDRMLALWRRLAPGTPSSALGGNAFRLAASILGPISAGRLFRWWQNGTYESIRTVPSETMTQLMCMLPPP